LLDVTSANAAKNGLLEQRPELRGLQAAVLRGQVPQNVPCLNAGVEKMSPAMVVKTSRPLAHQALIAAGTVGEGAPGHGAGCC